MNKKKTTIISIMIIVIAAVILAFIFLTEPKAEREGASIKTAMLVDVVRVNRSDYTPTIMATGTVQAAKNIVLSPQVGGEVVNMSEDFIPGSFVKKGEMLLQINPADYRNALQLRKSDLQLAKSDLDIEMGRQEVAQKDYELVGIELSEKSRSLVLRQPQLEAAKANVEAAEANVEQAQLDLQRTTIRAPFDAHVISRNTNIGSQVSPGVEVGRLVGIEEYWIVANIPAGKVAWLTFAEKKNNRGAEVKITHKSWVNDQIRIGVLSTLIGELDDQTRLARVIITVPDPMGYLSQSDSLPPLMIGTFVETEIQARELKDVIRINRDYLRKGENVWVMRDNKLAIREVDIIFEDADYAYIKAGLSDGDLLVTSDLSTVVEGSELRTENNGELKSKQM